MAPKAQKRAQETSNNNTAELPSHTPNKRAKMNNNNSSSSSSSETLANSASTDTHNDKHTNYTHWAQNQGIVISSVSPLALPSRGIGLCATSPVSADDRLILVPSKAMLKVPAQFLKTHALTSASPQAQLAAYLTLSSLASPQPEWYMQSRNVWPTLEDFKACMLAWSGSAELEVLKGLAPPGVRGPLERLLLDLEEDGGGVGHLFRGKGEGGRLQGNGANGHAESGQWRENWIYHWILVNTRSFHWKPVGVREGSMVMCPFLDYMNHCPNGHGCTVTVSTQGYELRADRSYKPGEEILATYGAHPNDKLLVHYGFILPDSPDDEIRLDHVILPRLSESQQNILRDVGYLGGYALDPNTNELCFKTQVAIRSVLLTANEWEHYMGSGEDLASDKDNEVIEWLRPALVEYAQQADDAVEKLDGLRKEQTPSSAFESKLALLQARWEQIREALERFLDPPIEA